MTDISLDPGEVRRHASSVDEFAGAIATALSAAQYVRASGGAYGQLVGPMFAADVNIMQALQMHALSSAETGAHRLAAGLRKMAANLEDSDFHATNCMGSVR